MVTAALFEGLWAQGAGWWTTEPGYFGPGCPHESGLGLVNLKKLIVLVVVAFLLFFLITQPTGSAGVVTNILTWLKDGATAIVTFVRSLFG